MGTTVCLLILDYARRSERPRRCTRLSPRRPNPRIPLPACTTGPDNRSGTEHHCVINVMTCSLLGERERTGSGLVCGQWRDQPQTVGSCISARSNSANAPNTCSTSRPDAQVVSICSPSDRRPTPRPASSSTSPSSSGSERPSRSSRATTTVFPRDRRPDQLGQCRTIHTHTRSHIRPHQRGIAITSRRASQTSTTSSSPPPNGRFGSTPNAHTNTSTTSLARPSSRALSDRTHLSRVDTKLLSHRLISSPWETRPHQDRTPARSDVICAILIQSVSTHCGRSFCAAASDR